MIKIFLNGEHYSTGQMPKTIPGVKLSNLQSASPEQLLKHGITTEPYTPPEPIPPTEEELALQFEEAVKAQNQAIIDAKAKEYGFDSIHTAGIWIGRRPMATELIDWAASRWNALDQIKADVLAGTRGMPESVEAVLDELPEWSEV